MPDYTLSKLPSAEFEQLCRDLLQKRDHVQIESFKEGKDGGIDLRFAKGQDKNIIVQAKCYKTWNELKPKLREEAEKVRRLNPDRYIFVTSVPLSPQNKADINVAFSPYIKNTIDILGNEDINNLLSLYPEIEEEYYRLWLCSTNILNKILHRKVINWSNFKLEECIESKNTFVYNENYVKAKIVLDKYNYVIISGIPGIGKTTLAEILVLEYLKNDYEEFVFISDRIEDALELYDNNKKQVFLFDDFLGSNSFEPTSKNFDSNLTSFIRRVGKSENKKFILTTREYILQEARLHYEKLSKDRIDIAKCVVDMGAYTDKIKAQILYNHLYFAGIPMSSIENLLDNNNYLQIIKHQNFNPRLVETIVVQQLWDSSSAGTFFDRIYNVFEHPNRIWEVAFNKLEKVPQYALLVLVTMPVPVMLKDWRNAFLRLAKNTISALNIPCDEVSWKNALRILDGCFVKTNNNQILIVTFYNPSIIDFLVDYLKNMNETTGYLIENASFADQLTSIFIQEDKVTKATRKIVLNDDNLRYLAHSVKNIFHDFRICKLNYSKHDRESSNVFEFLIQMYNLYPKLFREHLTLTPELLSNEIFLHGQGSVYDKIETLDSLNEHINYLNKKIIIESIFKEIEDGKDLEVFSEYIVKNPEVEFVINEQIENKIRRILNEEVDIIEDEDDLNLEKNIANTVFANLKLNADDLISRIEDKIEIKSQEAMSDHDYPDDFDVGVLDSLRDADIVSLFQSLRDSKR